MPTGRQPGIRQRRHEAAGKTLEELGWKAVGPAVNRTRRYRQTDHPPADLMVGEGGALYWTEPGTFTIIRQARANDSPAIEATLHAVRHTS